jgi:hypothetical protein
VLEDPLWGERPTIADVQNGETYSSFRREFDVEPAPNGGAYLFAWNFGERVHAVHM